MPATINGGVTVIEGPVGSVQRQSGDKVKKVSGEWTNEGRR